MGQSAPGAEEGRPPHAWRGERLWAWRAPVKLVSAQGLAAGPVPKHLWSPFPGQRHLEGTHVNKRQSWDCHPNWGWPLVTIIGDNHSFLDQPGLQVLTGHLDGQRPATLPC